MMLAESLPWVVLLVPDDRGHRIAALEPLAAELRARHLATQVQIAVLSGTHPTITEVLDQALQAEATQVIMVSTQVVPERSFEAWCQRVVGHWQRDHEGMLDIRFAAPLSEQAAVVEAIKAALASSRPNGASAPLLSPAWDAVPGFSRHLLVCRGPRCSAQGAGEVARQVNDDLAAHQLGDDDVLVTSTGCLFPCSQGPVVVVYPDNVWYEQMTPDRVSRMIDDHLIGGSPVVEFCGRRKPTAMP